MSDSVAQSYLQIRQIYRLIQLVHTGDTVAIEKMLKFGVENLINLTEPQDGVGVLHIAAAANNRDMLNFLLSMGANPNIQDKKGRTSVMLAAELGNDIIMELLAEHNANFKLQDTKGKGVLFYCTHPTERHARCLQVALTHQADVNNVSTEGVHIFQLMCENAQEFASRCMLDAGADPNATNQETGATALMEAAKAGSPQVVRTILKMGGNPNAVDKNKSTAIHYAAMGGCFEVFPLLSAYSAHIDVVNNDECTPLHYAAAVGDANCCKFLIQRGCSPKLKNKEGLLPHQIAKDAGHKAAVKELKKTAESKESKEDTFISDLWVLTLHDWIQEKETELRQAFGGDKSDTVTAETVVSVLEELKAPVGQDQLQKIISGLDKTREDSVNIDDFINGATYIEKPFLLSSYKPKTERGKKGAKSRVKKRNGKFVLHMPICYLPPELMPRRPDGGPPLFMIRKYTDTSGNYRFDRDHPPEHHPMLDDSAWYTEETEKAYISINYCVRSGDLKSIAHALAEGVPVDVKDPYYQTPLMVACFHRSLEIAQYLISQWADVNAVDGFFWTPLHHAAFTGHLELVKLLVEAGANINARALNGGTPLMRAIQASQLSCVDFLIKAGADVKAESKAGKNCLDIAKDFGDSSIIDLVKNEMDSLLEPEEDTMGKGDKSQKGSKDKPQAKASK